MGQTPKDIYQNSERLPQDLNKQKGSLPFDVETAQSKPVSQKRHFSSRSALVTAVALLCAVFSEPP